MGERSTPPTLISKILFNIAALAVFLIVEFALVQGAQRMLGTWQVVDIAQFAGCLVGAGVAVRLRAWIAACVVAAMAAVTTAELSIHLYYGIRSAQGAPTHFAVLGSAVLGVGFGALLARYWFRDRAATTANDVQPSVA